MTKEIQTYIHNGWVLDGRQFIGKQNDQIRKEMIADKAKFVSDGFVWTFPNQAIFEKYKAYLDSRNGEKPKQELIPPPSAVIPLPKGSNMPMPTALPMPTSLPKLPGMEFVELPKEIIGRKRIFTELKAPEYKAVAATVNPALTETMKVLKLEPSRLAIIHIETNGPRKRRQLARKEERDAGKQYGVESMTVTTTTEQLIINPNEHTEAKRLQGEIGYLIRKVGTRVSDGVIAFPLKNEAEFDEARAEGRRLALDFNTKSVHYKIVVDAIKLEAVESDEELVARKVTYDIQRMLKEMKEALDACDVERIRSVATDAKYKAASLAAGTAQGVLLAAVEDARRAASQITREVEERGRTIESVKQELKTQSIDSARMMFLDYSIPEEVTEQSAVDTARFAELG